MTLTDDVNGHMKDKFVGYLGGLARIDHTPSMMGVDTPTLPSELHFKWCSEIDPAIRFDILASWTAALQDAVVKLAAEVERLRAAQPAAD